MITCTPTSPLQPPISSQHIPFSTRYQQKLRNLLKLTRPRKLRKLEESQSLTPNTTNKCWVEEIFFPSGTDRSLVRELHSWCFDEL